MKLEISKERVLEAASKCPTAKETLKTLFPEVFDNGVVDDFEKAIANLINTGQATLGYHAEGYMEKIYRKIPGQWSEDKAAYIVKLLGLK